MNRHLVRRVLLNFRIPGQRPNFSEVGVFFPTICSRVAGGNAFIYSTMPPIVHVHAIDWRSDLNPWVMVEQIPGFALQFEFKDLGTVIGQNRDAEIIVFENHAPHSTVHPVS